MKTGLNDNTQSLNNIRDRFTNPDSALTEESIRDMIRQEVLITKQDNEIYQQGKQKISNQNQQYEQKKIKFNEPNQQINQQRNRIIMSENQINPAQQNPDYNNEQIKSEDLRNTVLFEQIQNQKQNLRQNDGSLWGKVLLFYEKNDLNSCYQLVLDGEDDIYLIKLMMLTGPCMKELEIETSKRLMQRMCMVLDSKFLEKIRQNIEQKQLTHEVYKLTSSSNSEVGEASAELYIRLSQKYSYNF